MTCLAKEVYTKAVASSWLAVRHLVQDMYSLEWHLEHKRKKALENSIATIRGKSDMTRYTLMDD